MLGCRFFSFSTLNILYYSFLYSKVSAKNSVGSSTALPYTYNQLLFSCCFLNFLFILNHWHLNYYILESGPVGFTLFGTLYASSAWMPIFFPRLRNSQALISLNKVSVPFLPLSSFLGPCNVNVYVWCSRDLFFFFFLSRDLLTCFHLKIFFFLVFIMGAFSYSHLPVGWSILLHALYWLLVVYFYFSYGILSSVLIFFF